MDKVGFIGLGRMGSRMAASVAAAGFPLTVYNRTTARAEAFAAEHGAAVAATPSDLAAAVDVVVTMLADGEALLAVYRGEDGVLAGLRPGAMAVEMSTVGPELVGGLAAEVAASGATLVDAPVSGSVAAAEARTLMIMAGGEVAAVEAVRPVLEAIGGPVLHVGPPGSGATMKLAVNSVIFTINQGLAEALVMAERSGVDRTVAYDTFSASAAGAPVVKYRRDVFVAPGETPVTFTIDLGAKDLDLITQHAKRVGTSLPAAEAAASVMRSAAAAGLGGGDMGDVAAYLRDRAGGAAQG